MQGNGKQTHGLTSACSLLQSRFPLAVSSKGTVHAAETVSRVLRARQDSCVACMLGAQGAPVSMLKREMPALHMSAFVPSYSVYSSTSGARYLHAAAGFRPQEKCSALASRQCPIKELCR